MPPMRLARQVVLRCQRVSAFVGSQGVGHKLISKPAAEELADELADTVRAAYK